jgi:hypothetical protein
MDTLDFFNDLEESFKLLGLMGSTVRDLEGFKKNGEYKFSKKRYTINEMEFTFGDKIQFWVSNGGRCHTVGLDNMLINILFTSNLEFTGPEAKLFQGFKEVTKRYLVQVLRRIQEDKTRSRSLNALDALEITT